MHALKRKVKTYKSYTEHWSEDYRLTVSYNGESEFEVQCINGAWSACDYVNFNTDLYLSSAAAVEDALEKCVYFNMPFSMVGEFLPQNKVLPQELLRALLDDKGLCMDDALKILVQCFGHKLTKLQDTDWLSDLQPRTAALTDVLRDELGKSCLVLHDAYNEFYRSPVGSVAEGTAVRFSLLAFGAVSEAVMCVSSSTFYTEIPMHRDGDVFVCSFTPETPAAYSYRFKYNGNETTDFSLTAYCRDFETPSWFKRGIMYQIFPDRFGFTDDGTAQKGIEYHRSLGQTPELHESISEPVKWQAREGEKNYAPDDFYGGTLNGITAKLPYLQELGISIIYLNPVVEARSNHRYDTADYMQVDPILGSMRDYVNLCAEAKKLGIRIINDGVFSHTGADSIYFNKYCSYVNCGACQSQASPYYEWYDFSNYPHDYKSWWGFKELPEVNEKNPVWQEYVVTGENSVVKHWLRNGASGWRLDVADELPDEVLSLIRKAAKSEKSDAVIIGEVWEDAVTKVSYGQTRNYALGYSLDSVMNYPFRSAVIDFALGRISSYELRDFLLWQMHSYPKPMYPALMNLLGSHDVARLHTVLALGEEFKDTPRNYQSEITLSEQEKERATALQKLCAAIQYSVPGVPCLYYGDEECLDGAMDPFNRVAFEPQNVGLHNYYVKLGSIRSHFEVLRNGEMEIETPAPNIIIIYRILKNVKLACVINRSPAIYNVPFDGITLLNGTSGGELPPCSSEIFLLT